MTSLLRTPFALLLPVLPLSVVGCKSAEATSDAGGFVMSRRSIDGDPSLANDVNLLDARFVEKGTDRSAQFSLVLSAGSRRSLLFHVEWFDALGRPIDSRPETWIPIELSTGKPVPVRVEAPSSDTRSFRLKFQRPEEFR